MIDTESCVTNDAVFGSHVCSVGGAEPLKVAYQLLLVAADV